MGHDMTFVQNVATPIASPNPGPALYAALEPTLFALGWELIATVVIGGNTHKVLRSAGAGNAQGLDFYVDINYPTTGITGGIRIAPFEDFNPTGNLGIRGPYAQSNQGVPDPTTFSRFGAAGYALETTWNNTASSTALSLVLATSGLVYWASITRNRIILMLSSLPTRMIYSGFYLPTPEFAAHAGDALFPLIVVVTFAGANMGADSAGSNSYMSFTRMPRLTSAPGLVNNWSYQGHLPGLNAASMLGAGLAGTPSEMVGSVRLAPVPIVAGAQSPAAGQPGQRVGDLEDVRSGFVPTTFLRGDHVVEGADTFYGTAPNQNHTYFMKAV
jgi:hypothetical protein